MQAHAMDNDARIDEAVAELDRDDVPAMSADLVDSFPQATLTSDVGLDLDEEDADDVAPGDQRTVDDPIRLYLREIGRVPMITHDREIELAQRIEMGDREAMKQFILANLRLVVSIAKRYVGRGLTRSNRLFS